MRPFKKSPGKSERNKQETGIRKVLLAGHLPPPWGGIATYYQSLLNSSLLDKVNLKFVQTSTHNRNLSQSGRLTVSNLIDAVKDCLRFTKAISSHRPQICHIGTAFGLSFIKHGVCVFIARISGSRVLLHPHCSLSAVYPEKSSTKRWLFRKIIRMTTGVIALSNEWRRLTEIVPDSQVYILPNAIDLAPYKAIAQSRFENAKLDGDVRILYLGYIGQAKGSFDLLEAARYMGCDGKQIYIDLVGDELRAGEVNSLQEGIESVPLPVTVRLHPSVGSEEKLSYFHHADIFVFPSYSEGLPMAVIEAMASGMPVVASNVGGLPDLVKEGVNGILIEPGHPKDLANALMKIIADDRLRQIMGYKGAQIASEEFDIEQHVLKLVDIYEQSLHC